MRRILIADDEQSIRFTFEAFLEEAGYTVDSVATLSECIKSLQNISYDLLFLDLYLGSDNSIDYIKDMKLIQPECAIIIITGSLESSAMAKARKCGSIDFLVKPIRQSSLLYVAQRVLELDNAVNH